MVPSGNLKVRSTTPRLSSNPGLKRAPFFCLKGFIREPKPSKKGIRVVLGHPRHLVEDSLARPWEVRARPPVRWLSPDTAPRRPPPQPHFPPWRHSRRRTWPRSSLQALRAGQGRQTLLEPLFFGFRVVSVQGSSLTLVRRPTRCRVRVWGLGVLGSCTVSLPSPFLLRVSSTALH